MCYKMDNNTNIYYNKINAIFQRKTEELHQIYLNKLKNKKMTSDDKDKLNYSISSTLAKIKANENKRIFS